MFSKSFILFLPLLSLTILDPSLSQIKNIQLTSNTYTQSEPYIAIHPTNPHYSLAVWKDFYNSQTQQAGCAFTNDGWNTFTTTILNNLIPNYPYGSDPSAALDNHGNVFYCGIFEGPNYPWNLFVARRTLTNSTWAYTQLTNYTELTFADRPMIIVDNTGGQYDGRVYVCWTGSEGQGILLKYSLDGGQSFPDSNLKYILSPVGTGCDAYEASLAIDPTGGVYVVYSDQPYIYVAKCTDVTTQNFSQTQTPVTSNLVHCASPITIGSYRAGYFPKMIVTAGVSNVKIHVVYSNEVTSNVFKVHYASSSDGGFSWSDQLIGNFSSSSSEFEPSITSNQSGRISIAYYHCDDPSDTQLVDYYINESIDNGQTFTKPVRITTAQSNAKYGDASTSDYAGLAGSNGIDYAVWCDTRFATQNISNNSDIYLAKLTTLSSSVSANWNLISVPIIPDSFAKSAIWPTSSSPAWTYQDSIYISKDPDTNGVGYWLRFPQGINVSYIGSSITSDTVRIDSGWNMIGSLSFSLPKNKINSSVNGMILSNYFGYTYGSGYYPVDTLYPGYGYWVDVNQRGFLVLDTSNAQGSGSGNGVNPPCPPFAPSIPIPASPQSGTTGVSTSPTLSWNATTCATKYHLQVSSNSFFSPLIVDDSTITGTSRQVSGLSYWTEYYWRLSSINGYGSSDWSSIWYFVTMSNNPPPPCQCCANMLTDLDQLSVGDASGNSQRLYVVHGARQLNLGFTNYGLPPETPRGLFGARFGSGRFIESIPADSQSRVSLPIKVKDVTFPITIKWKLKNENALRYWLTLPGTQGRNKVALNGQTGNTTVSGTDNGVLILNVQPMMIQPCPPQQGTVERSGDIDEKKDIPTETKLFPNYPNPFNNSTTFTYQLSTPGIVQMKVYNLLGEEIAILVDNESKDAGYYSATWNADKMASGIYYVRMIITDRTDKQVYQNVNKLILLK
jgi:hypothetical protein